VNLYQKLIELRSNFPYLKKDGKGFNYTYVEESTILGIMSPSMNKLNLLLSQEIVDMQTAVITIPPEKKGGTILAPAREANGVRVKFQYTWINAENPEERLVCTQFLQDVEGDVQACGGLMTYGMRYFLLKFLNIATDEQDPDAFAAKMKELIGEEKITKENLAELEEELKGFHEISSIVLRRFECKELKELPLLKFGEILLGIKQMKATQIAKAAK
jgi:hypothetical protein